jgi:hypothetical protein
MNWKIRGVILVFWSENRCPNPPLTLWGSYLEAVIFALFFPIFRSLF